MEGYKNNNDKLDFICEVCGDREGGCIACRFGQKQKRIDSESDENDIANPDEIKEFFDDTRNIIGGI